MNSFPSSSITFSASFLPVHRLPFSLKTFKASTPVNAIILQPCAEYTNELSFQLRQYLPTVLTTSASIKQPTCQLNKGSHSANKEQIGRSSRRRAPKVPKGPKPPRCKHRTARSLYSITIRVLIASPRCHDPPYPASSTSQCYRV